MGSGCFGRKDHKDSVIGFHMKRDPVNPLVYEVVFEAQSYTLQGDKPIHRDHPTFARECAFRVAAYPAQGWEIAQIHWMSDGLTIKKAPGVEGDIFVRLVTGEKPLAQWHKKIEGKDQKTHLPISVTSPVSPTTCQAPRILGTDMSFISRRETFSQDIQITPSGSGLLTMRIQLKPC